MNNELIDDFELVVGDSSDIFMLEAPNIGSFDENWSAWMAITAELETKPIVLREVPVNKELLDDNGKIIEQAGKYFVIQITPAESALLTSDIRYYFLIRIKNDVLGYKKEIVQCRLKAKKQGIFR